MVPTDNLEDYGDWDSEDDRDPITCPECGRLFSLDHNDAYGSVACPACGYDCSEMTEVMDELWDGDEEEALDSLLPSERWRLWDKRGNW